MDEIKHIKVTCYSVGNDDLVYSHRVCDSNVKGKIKIHYDHYTKNLVVNIFEENVLQSDWIKKNQDTVDLSEHAKEYPWKFNW